MKFIPVDTSPPRAKIMAPGWECRITVPPKVRESIENPAVVAVADSGRPRVARASSKRTQCKFRHTIKDRGMKDAKVYRCNNEVIPGSVLCELHLYLIPDAKAFKTVDDVIDTIEKMFFQFNERRANKVDILSLEKLANMALKAIKTKAEVPASVDDEHKFSNDGEPEPDIEAVRPAYVDVDVLRRLKPEEIKLVTRNKNNGDRRVS